MEKDKEQITNEKGLVEESFQLKSRYFGRGLLHPAQSLADELYGTKSMDGRKGKFEIKGSAGSLFVSYTVSLGTGSPVLKLFYIKDPTKMDGGQTQEITLDTQELHYGTRWYFSCEGCSKRTNSLYLPTIGLQFACRTCQNLTYESCRTAKTSMNGIPYYVSRKIKLAHTRESIDRISYRGQTTKRAARFFRMYDRLENSYTEQTKSMAYKLFAVA